MAQDSDTLEKMDPIDIMNLAQKAGQTVASNKETKLKIEQIMDTQASQIQDQQGNLDNIAKADSTITAEKNRFLAETDARKAAAEVALSSDFRQQGSETNKWAAAVIENANKAYTALDAIHAKEKVTLIDNPLDYIMNKFTLPADKAEYNHYVAKHNVAESTLNELVAGTTAAAQMADKMQRSTSAEQAVAENDKILQTAAFNKNKLTIDNAAFRINGLTTLNSLSAQELDIASKLLSASNADEHLKLSKQSHALAVQDHALKQKSLALQIADRSERMEDRRDQLAAATQTMNEYNVGAKQVGGMEFNDPKRFMAMLPTLSKDPDAVSKMVAGQKLLYNQANKIDAVVPVAPTAGAAARIYAKSNTQGNEVGTMLSSLYSKFEGQVGMKDPAVLEATVTKAARDEAVRQSQIIDSREPNIYNAPPLRIMLGVNGNARLAAVPFFRDTIVPVLSANDKADFNPEQMAAKAVDYVSKNPQELNSTISALTSYYGTAKSVNNVTKQYESNMLPNQTQFKVRLKSPSLDLGGGRVYDFESPTDWKRIVMSATMINKGNVFNSPSPY